jgi:hypothetical protein
MASDPVLPILPLSTVQSIYDALSASQTVALVQPDNPPPGISGFLFDIPTEENSELTSLITDHWLESNISVQDNIALAPVRVTLRGLVAELVYTPPNTQNSAAPAAVLPANSTMQPQFSPGTTQAMAASNAQTSGESQSVSAVNSPYQYYAALNLLGGTGVGSRQINAFSYFQQLWSGRMLCTVQTAYGYWTNMAIESVRATSPEETRYVSEFTVVFKQINIAGGISVNSGQLAGRAVGMLSSQTSSGLGGAQPVTPVQQSQYFNASFGGGS